MTPVRLCALSDIPDGGSAGFVADFGPYKVAVAAIRQGDRVHVYENVCPHVGTPLDFRPGQFLDLERKNIMCATHGALFRIEDGHCFQGPCTGKKLTRINARLQPDGLYVDPPTR